MPARQQPAGAARKPGPSLGSEVTATRRSTLLLREAARRDPLGRWHLSVARRRPLRCGRGAENPALARLRRRWFRWGAHVTTVRVATNGESHAEFHDVVLWGQLADFACQYLGKGRLVYIEGRLQSRQWQATDGSTRRTVEIVANRLQALSSKSASEAPAA